MSKLEELAKVVSASGTIELNPHKAFYEKAYEYFNDRDFKRDEVGVIDWDKDIWEAHIYPKTPVGFICGISNSIDDLLDWAIEGSKEY